MLFCSLFAVICQFQLRKRAIFARKPNSKESRQNGQRTSKLLETNTTNLVCPGSLVEKKLNRAEWIAI